MGKEGDGKFDKAGAEISLLNQLVKTAGDSFDKLKVAYKKNDSENFNKLKVILIQTERRIFEETGE